MVTLRTSLRRAALNEKLRALGIEQQIKSGRRKFANTPSVYNGQTYDSAGEAQYAMQLDMKLKAGEIIEWTRGEPIVIDDRCATCNAPPSEACIDARGKTMRGYHRDRMTFTPDFWIVPAQASQSHRDYTYSYYVDYKGSSIDKKTGKRHAPTETALWRRKMIQRRKNVPFELRVAYSDGTERVVCPGQK
jgi:hypothetical protein